MVENDRRIELEISEDVLEKWQRIMDTSAELLNIPAALIMRVVQADIEVFVSSRGVDNPYRPGEREHLLGSGLYCETVIKSNKKLLVPNARNDDKWKNNPDSKLNMISYLGFPILLPDGKPFGTICALDNKENSFSQSYEILLKNFRDIVQSELALIYINKVHGEENNSLTDYLAEIKILRGIIPICVRCKKIKDDKGYWTQVDKYIEEHSHAQFSHGICEECADKLYGEQHWYQVKKNKAEKNN